MNKAKEFFKILASLVGVILLTFLVGVVLGRLGFPTESPYTGLIAILLTQVIFGLAAYFIIKRKKRQYGEDFVLNTGLKSDSWKMVLIGLGTAGFGNILISIIMNLLGENSLVNSSIDMVSQALAANTPASMFLQAVILVIIAPICEEYLFRGYVFGQSKRVFSLKAAVLINGLLFGLYHMNLLQGINTFFLGMVLTLVYYSRSNISDAILVHASNNAVAVITMLMPQYASIIGIVLIISLFVGGWTLYKVIKRR